MPELPIREAAAATGRSVATLRRDIRRGVISARKEHGRIVVMLPEAAPTPAVVPAGDLAIEVARLRAALTAVTAERDRLIAQVERLGDQASVVIGQLGDRDRAVEAALAIIHRLIEDEQPANG